MSTRGEIRERWRRLVDEQQASGMSVTAFCRRAGVRCSGYYKWRRKLGGRGSFTEVHVKRLPAITSSQDHERGAAPLELRLSGERTIVVRRGFDRQVLQELLDTLEANEPTTARREAKR